MSRPPVGNLVIFIDPNRDLTPWDREPTSWNRGNPAGDIFQVVSKFVHLGLCALESPEGRQCLVDCGNRVIRAWDERGQPHCFGYWRRSMRYCVNFFLDIIRRRFPDLYLTSTIKGEGSTLKAPWGSNLEDYDPKVAAKIYLNRIVRSALGMHHRSRRLANRVIWTR